MLFEEQALVDILSISWEFLLDQKDGDVKDDFWTKLVKVEELDDVA